MKYEYIIGIDTGVNTGLAVFNNRTKKFESIKCHAIHDVMHLVKFWARSVDNQLIVLVEDARLRKWFGNSGREKLQGAGSVKRDAKIWEDYLTAMCIPFEMIAPKNNKTKLTDQQFRKLSQWDKATNVHGRDAAMLVINNAIKYRWC